MPNSKSQMANNRVGRAYGRSNMAEVNWPFAILPPTMNDAPVQTQGGLESQPSLPVRRVPVDRKR